MSGGKVKTGDRVCWATERFSSSGPTGDIIVRSGTVVRTHPNGDMAVEPDDDGPELDLVVVRAAWLVDESDPRFIQPRTAKVIVIRPGEDPVVESIVDGLEAWRALVGGDIEGWMFADELHLTCHGQGRMVGLEPNFEHARLGICVGTCVVSRSDEDGNTADVREGDLETVCAGMAYFGVAGLDEGQNRAVYYGAGRTPMIASVSAMLGAPQYSGPREVVRISLATYRAIRAAKPGTVQGRFTGGRERGL